MLKYSRSSVADGVVVSSLPAHRTTASVSSAPQTAGPQRSHHWLQPWLQLAEDNQRWQLASYVGQRQQHLTQM